MNNNCEFAGGGYCLCSACQAARQALEDAKKVTQEEIEELFREAEKMMEECGGGRMRQNGHIE